MEDFIKEKSLELIKLLQEGHGWLIMKDDKPTLDPKVQEWLEKTIYEAAKE